MLTWSAATCRVKPKRRHVRALQRNRLPRLQFLHVNAAAAGLQMEDRPAAIHRAFKLVALPLSLHRHRQFAMNAAARGFGVQVERRIGGNLHRHPGGIGFSTGRRSIHHPRELRLGGRDGRAQRAEHQRWHNERDAGSRIGYRADERDDLERRDELLC